jgi:hypothetical protein
MVLILSPDQPPESPPTIAELQARAEDLPVGYVAFALRLLRAPGLTGADLCFVADAADEQATEWGTLVRGSEEEAGWRALAAILRDAAPRFPHPPRQPISAEEADRSIRAAGIATAGGAT